MAAQFPHVATIVSFSNIGARQAIRNLRLGFLAMAALLVTLGIAFAWHSWRAEKEHEFVYLSSIVEITGNSLDDYFASRGRRLQQLGDDLLQSGKPPGSPENRELLKRLRESDPDLLDVVVSLPDGSVLVAGESLAGAAVPALDDIPSFRAAVAEMEAGPALNIGRPFKSPRAADAWVIPLRYGVRDAAGKMQFVITAPLPLSRQQVFWHNVSLPPDSAIGLLRDDGYLVSRHPLPPSVDYEEMYGKPRSGALREHLARNGFPADGITEGYNSVAQANYLFAFHRLSNQPLTVFVSTPIANVRDKWLRQMQFSLLVSLALLAGSYFVYRWSCRRQLDWEKERDRQEEEIHFLATHDPLTRLPNRMLCRDRMQQAISQASRNGNKVALLFIDLDNFKNINDSLGHSIGDALLQCVAGRLQCCLRKCDTLSRQGGDEFQVILADLQSPEAVLRVVGALQTEMAHPFEIEGHELACTHSLGIAVYPDDGMDFETLLRQADTAMYNAKARGRNTHSFYDQKMNAEADERLRMRHWLAQALENESFVLHYQPQVDLGSGRIIGVEALIRMEHRSELVYPGRFIAAAEDSGLIIPMGQWTLRQACRQVAAWRRTGWPDLVMAVNLSAVQFKRGDLEKCVSAALEESGLPGSCLELELTESILIDNAEPILATLQGLQARGVRISIDDFGTGYSNLAYLKRFNVDRLKIDRSFVRELHSDPEDAAIVQAIIQMAHSLDIRTLAEGVEDEATLDCLRAQGCDEAQGYFLGRPVPAEQLSVFLADHRAGEQSAASPQ